MILLCPSRARHLTPDPVTRERHGSLAACSRFRAGHMVQRGRWFAVTLVDGEPWVDRDFCLCFVQAPIRLRWLFSVKRDEEATGVDSHSASVLDSATRGRPSHSRCQRSLASSSPLGLAPLVPPHGRGLFHPLQKRMRGNAPTTLTPMAADAPAWGSHASGLLLVGDEEQPLKGKHHLAILLLRKGPPTLVEDLGLKRASKAGCARNPRGQRSEVRGQTKPLHMIAACDHLGCVRL